MNLCVFSYLFSLSSISLLLISLGLLIPASLPSSNHYDSQYFPVLTFFCHIPFSCLFPSTFSPNHPSSLAYLHLSPGGFLHTSMSILPQLHFSFPPSVVSSILILENLCHPSKSSVHPLSPVAPHPTPNPSFPISKFIFGYPDELQTWGTPKIENN